MIITSIRVGRREDGLDLNGDGDPDNKFATLADLLEEPVADAFANYDLVFPLEYFDMDEPAADDCVKVAVYSGDYRIDSDEDDHATAGAGGDCDDMSSAANPEASEIPDNGLDDNCNGYADETIEETDGGPIIVPSPDTSDADGDTFTIADGDCNDHNNQIHPGLAEICGDGLDNNCDGVADWTVDANPPHCSPFDDENDPLYLAAESFDGDGAPVRAFRRGTIEDRDGTLHLHTGPAVFPLSLPTGTGSTLDLIIGEAYIDGDLVMTPAGWALENARLGGVIRAVDADQIDGLDIPSVGLLPENSLLDGIFAGTLGALLSLAYAPLDTPGEGCLTPDIDVDGDGLEAFCDTTPDNDRHKVTRCVDGDGTVVDDTDTAPCSAAVDSEGKLRFVDGVSLVILFTTQPSDPPVLQN
jgi:hypothetical protein